MIKRRHMALVQRDLAAFPSVVLLGPRFFYRTRSGAELDLLLLLPGQERWAIEVQRSSAPRVPRGFRIATTDVSAAEKFIVYAGTETYPLGDGITAVPLPALMERPIAKG